MAKKKVQAIRPVSARQELVGPCPELSIRRQCELVDVSRSGFYYEPVGETAENLLLMRRLDEMHLEHPVYGSRRLRQLLCRQGLVVNRKRVIRLLQLMGVEACQRSVKRDRVGSKVVPFERFRSPTLSRQ